MHSFCLQTSGSRFTRKLTEDGREVCAVVLDRVTDSDLCMDVENVEPIARFFNISIIRDLRQDDET